MERKSLEERIMYETRQKVNEIETETQSIIAKMQKEALDKINNTYKEKVNERLLKVELDIKTAEKQLENEVIAYERKSKQNVIFHMFEEVLLRINSLEKDQLLKWVAKLLNETEVKGNETIIVSDYSYEIYLKSLSSLQDEKNLDKLTEVNDDYKFNLKKGLLGFDDGFIVIGDTYDMIFDFKEIVSSYQKKEELKLFKELFDNE